MEYAQALLIGFLVAFFGLLPPGMINMTILKVSLEAGRREAILFTLGAVVLTVVEAFLAATFIRFLVGHPQITEYLNYAGIVIFLGLAVFFYYKARRPIDRTVEEEMSNPFWKGFGVAAANLLTIPYLIGACALLRSRGWLEVEPPCNYLFAAGTMVGSLALFFLYIWFAELIDRHVDFIARNVNYILAVLLLGMAVLTAVRVW